MRDAMDRLDQFPDRLVAVLGHKNRETPMSLRALAMSPPATAWRRVHWGDNLGLSARFARLRPAPT